MKNEGTSSKINGIGKRQVRNTGDWDRRRWIASAVGVTGLSSIHDMALAFDQSARGVQRSGTPRAARPASRMKISEMTVTLVASPDAAVLNSTSPHETHFRRTIVEIKTSDGHRGISEVGGGYFRHVETARPKVIGRDPFEIEYFRRTIEHVEAFGAVEMACLDLIGRLINRRVVDLIGGPYRDAQKYSAYVFFVMPTPEDPEGVTTPAAVAQQFVDFNKKYGFTACKFKGGVLRWEQEVEALKIMRKALPDAQLRIDPNAAWSVETSLLVAKAVEPLRLEYLEDPTGDQRDVLKAQDAMAAVRKGTRIPLATNMCVTQTGHIRPGFEKGAIDIVLLDNHHMGGLNNCRFWGATCEALGWGCSGHSNNHLGISMAEMTHMNCSIANIGYDADTHYPWTADDSDIIRGGKLQFNQGRMALPDAPGLGVEIDPDQMAKLKDNVRKAKSRKDLLSKWDRNYPGKDERGWRW